MIKSSYLPYFLSLIKTKKHADEVIAKLEELRGNLYNKRIDLGKKMSELFSYELKEKIMSLSWQEQVNLNDPESFGAFLESLRNYVKHMPIVKITLAFEPTDKIVEAICSWFVEQYGKNVILDLYFDPKLVAGAMISFNGAEKDFSLRRRIEDKLKEPSNETIRILH